MKKWFLLISLLTSIKIMAQVDIGESIVGCIIQDSSFYLLTSPNQLDEAYKIKCESIVYSVTLSGDKTINYISTSDKKFTTSDGSCVGKAFGAINKNDRVSKLYSLPGRGKIIELRSGWYAVFSFKKPLTKFSKIQFFFKRK